MDECQVFTTQLELLTLPISRRDAMGGSVSGLSGLCAPELGHVNWQKCERLVFQELKEVNSA